MARGFGIPSEQGYKGQQGKQGNAQKSATRLVGVNAQGRPVGEDHPKAVLSNAEVDLVFALRDEGFSIRWLAAKMEVSVTCIADILSGRRRAVIPVGYKRRKT